MTEISGKRLTEINDFLTACGFNNGGYYSMSTSTQDVILRVYDSGGIPGNLDLSGLENMFAMRFFPMLALGQILSNKSVHRDEYMDRFSNMVMATSPYTEKDVFPVILMNAIKHLEKLGYEATSFVDEITSKMLKEPGRSSLKKLLWFYINHEEVIKNNLRIIDFAIKNMSNSDEFRSALIEGLSKDDLGTIVLRYGIKGMERHILHSDRGRFLEQELGL